MDDSGITRARALAKLLDSAARVPGTSIRFGLDPVLGLVPVVGDLAGAALSGYIVLVGVRVGAPRAVVLRMLGNIAVDTIVSSVPMLGDIFDVGWKSNMRNVALLERHLEQPAATRAASRVAIGMVILLLALLALGGVTLTILAVKAVLGLLR
jgi:hypothetical protein